MSAPLPGGLATGRLGAAESDDDPSSPAQLISLSQPRQGMPSEAVPLAVFAAGIQPVLVTYFLHSDHLDRPVKMTDAARNLVFDAIYQPFGQLYAVSGTASLDARFPGQWFEPESGLAYNWQRHYDASTGRYTQPDPLGFIDGPSVYAYGDNSPEAYFDSTGLADDAPRSLPMKGPPSGSLRHPSGQIRIYNRFGAPFCDIDVHPEGGSSEPHLHFWAGNRRLKSIPLPIPIPKLVDPDM